MSEIIGIGTDVIEIDRVISYCEKNSFFNKYYTEAERKIIEKRKNRAATNFAGKEAVVKAFGTGFLNCMPGDIEILRDDFGEDRGIVKIHISLSDTDKIATAFVVAEGE